MYDYTNKLRGQDNRNSIFQILSQSTFKDWEIAKTEYNATDIAFVKIDGNTFTNYGQYQFIWEKTFVKEPQRSGSGSLGNLNSYATFLTPHLIMNFAVMSIDDYRAIMKLHYDRNEFTVECYDPIFNKKIKVKMYFATEEMAKLYTINRMRESDDGQWEEWIELVGVQNYTVELIGTNNELDLVSVRYVYNSDITPTGAPVPDQYEEDIYLGEEIVVGGNSSFPTMPPSSGLKFKHWVDSAGEIYTNGVVVTVNSELTLYAVWESKTSYTLSFNYGLADVVKKINSETGVMEDILDVEIKNTSNIGELPLLSNPYVEDSNIKKKYYPYENGGWYKYPVKQENMRVQSQQPYWTNRDTIIYALYDKKAFRVDYITNDPQTSIPSQNLTYGDSVWLPTLFRYNYTFQGWYIDENFTTAFSGTMPPYDITLYARWEKK